MRLMDGLTTLRCLQTVIWMCDYEVEIDKEDWSGECGDGVNYDIEAMKYFVYICKTWCCKLLLHCIVIM